jgi:hypothetical protein
MVQQAHRQQQLGWLVKPRRKRRLSLRKGPQQSLSDGWALCGCRYVGRGPRAAGSNSSAGLLRFHTGMPHRRPSVQRPGGGWRVAQHEGAPASPVLTLSSGQLERSRDVGGRLVAGDLPFTVVEAVWVALGDAQSRAMLHAAIGPVFC